MRKMMKKKNRVWANNSAMVTVPDELMLDILSMFHGGRKQRRRLSLEGGRDQNLGGVQSNSAAMMLLPDDVILEILMRLSGQKLMQCKSVCKAWLATTLKSKGLDKGPLIIQSPRLPCPNSDLGNINDGRLTEVVNGLVCFYDQSNLRLTLFNVCTAEGMRIHVPNHYHTSISCTQRFHLGYDPSTRMYKLLRYGIQPVGWRYQMQVEILTLMPPSFSGSLPTWRKLELVDNDTSCVYYNTKDSLISFDFNKEKFKVIKLQCNVADMVRTHSFSLIQSMGCPALRIVPEPDRGSRYFRLFLFENYNSNIWKTHDVQWPQHFGIMDDIVDIMFTR
ncbi:OLC1v1014797C1 [Oldenlandia corymbosa var. corymbosa]|uniref:OLC1v1014797C1 n=1 Tax=Oldenlandia corymbosa var. corymbosa TaxID=529605 RepID=A0AAV1E1T9_OLDCO|nr:OLC1v1014797C1 [Oldenlandia corymbosa var. corymbosa]